MVTFMDCQISIQDQANKVKKTSMHMFMVV